jgi:alpha-L-rhamnosidase
VNISTLWLPGMGTTLGLDVRPTLAWKLSSATLGDRQTAYELQVGTSVGASDLVATGKVPGIAQSYRLGAALSSRTVYYWRVRAYDALDVATAWVADTFETGLLEPAAWAGARWVGRAGTAAPQLRKAFTSTGTVASARLYVACGGYAEVLVNGTKVTDPLSPGFTAYDKRVQYVTLDVTAQVVSSGANVVAATLGRGWYGVTTTTDWGWATAPWHGDPRMMAMLRITYQDGSSQTIVTDATWKATSAGPTTSDSVYLGETYDARLQTTGWETSGYDDSSWAAASILTPPSGAVVAQTQTPIKALTAIDPDETVTLSATSWRYRFPEVLAGWVTVSVTGSSGDVTTIRYGEMIDGGGAVVTANGAITGNAQTDVYTSRGGLKTWSPRFSYKGFRYVQIDGPFQPATVQAIPVRTDLPVTGSWTSSNATLNQLAGMARKSLQINSHGIVTDTPQREKMGWLGDSRVTSQAALLDLGVGPLYRKWLLDMADAVTSSGWMPVIVPWSGYLPSADAPDWTAAFPVIAWRYYLMTGDVDLIANIFEKIRRHADYYLNKSVTNQWDAVFGDWSMPAGNNQDGGKDFTGSLSVLRMARAVADMAEALNRPDVAVGYRVRAEQIVTAINSRLLDQATGIYKPVSTYAGAMYQTPTVLALAHGIAPTSAQTPGATAVHDDVHTTKTDHLNTGILGAEYLLGVLCDYGHVDTAYAVATQTSFPSWGQWAAAGATTCWNNFGALATQGTLSHQMHGSYLAWLYQYLAGIKVTGLTHVDVAPVKPTGLTSVTASVETSRGTVTVAWGSGNLAVTIQPGMTFAYSGNTYRGAGTRNFAF